MDTQLEPPKGAATPRSELLRVAWAALVGVTITAAVSELLEKYFHVSSEYGVGLFCVLPLFMGLVSALAMGTQRPANSRQAAVLSLFCYTYCFIGMLVFALEGVVCLVMAAPLAIGVAMLGSFLGAGITNLIRNKFVLRSTYCAVSALPLLAAYSAAHTPTAAVRTETSVIVIDAPASRVWPLLFHVPKVAEPTWWLFRMGVAHPVAFEASSPDVGASRECRLSTGIMYERITASTPDRLLRFDVLNTPPTMKEWNPFYNVSTKHLVGYFNNHYGEFRLDSLPGNKTRLIGTSQYEYRLYPAPYWALWTDSIVEHVHLDAMNEIKREAENSVH